MDKIKKYMGYAGLGLVGGIWGNILIVMVIVFSLFFIIADLPSDIDFTLEKYYLVYFCCVIGGLLGGEALETNIGALFGGTIGYFISFFFWAYYFYYYINI